MTRAQYIAEWDYRMDERLGMICEDSRFKSGQRPDTPADRDQARREVAEDMDRLEKQE